MNALLALRPTRKRIALAGALGCGAVLVMIWTLRLPAQPPAEGDFRPRRVLAAQPPITDFPKKSVGQAMDGLNPSELVLAVTVGKESRAYPINMLTGPQREILNDTLGGRAIAATW
jgi:hypothetical protein